jgi:hypothetical protein
MGPQGEAVLQFTPGMPHVNEHVVAATVTQFTHILNFEVMLALITLTLC